MDSKKTTERLCDGQVVPAGVDISNTADPGLIGAVELPCDSHALSSAPDLLRHRLIVYSNNSSSSGCTGGNAAGDFIDVIEVPVGNPATARRAIEAAIARSSRR